jgi:hypothetical protein
VGGVNLSYRWSVVDSFDGLEDSHSPDAAPWQTSRLQITLELQSEL